MATSGFQKERHIKYMLRCLKTFLPHQYTSGDSSRSLWGFFILGGLDILGVLHSKTTPEERKRYIDWLYHCQVPSGGFRGFTGTKFGDDKRSPENEAWDPASVPATLFMLECLLILGDDLSRVERQKCLQWLSRMQREDGSFGELLGVDGKIEGDEDLRFGCCAAGIRYVLRGKSDIGLEGVPDIDVHKLLSHVESCQTHDGGFATSPFGESHAGMAYCAIGTLTFLSKTRNQTPESNLLSPQTKEHAALLRWLILRQTAELNSVEQNDDSDDDNEEETEKYQNSVIQDSGQVANMKDINDRIAELPDLIPVTEDEYRWAGFNGRQNKPADTCYCFWVNGTIAMLDRLPLVNHPANRRYLLEKTQHIIGGFGKGVGEPPDLLHSYLGLVCLALFGEPGLEEVDAAMCTTTRVESHLESIAWWRAD